MSEASAAETATEPTILHVDMDAFYASVEVQRDPSLAGKPVIVGASGDRGVVASCSYEARAFGIHSAMPSARARRLCPHAIFIDGDHRAYADYSRRLHVIFHRYTPLVEGIALDEAFLDVAGVRRLFGPAPEVARLIRQVVIDELGLGCSVGVATSKLIAKLASKAAKPVASPQGLRPGPGVVVIDAGDEVAFLHRLQVSALWGVGPATGERLRRMGVTTVGDLAALPRQTLVAALGTAVGHHLHELSWARDRRPVEPEQDVKSIGHEETYATDLVDMDDLHREAVRMADAVAGRLRSASLTGRTVTLKVRFHDFSTITRSHTLAHAVDSGPEVARAAAALLAEVDPSPGVRLLGVSVSNLVAGGVRQLSLEEAGGAQWEDASRAVDAVRSRFGPAAVAPAALLGERGQGLRVRQAGQQQWGPEG